MDDSPLLVVGMHRSGTSALTNLLAQLGMDLGPAASLMGASDSNLFGHFEQLPIVDLNDELLDAVGVHWAAPADRSSALVELANGTLGDRARSILFDLFGTSRRWLAKDPRFSLTLPFWRVVFEAQPTVSAPIRHPNAVAASLQRRDGIPLASGIAIWESYHRLLLRNTRGLDLHLVDFDEMISSPSTVVKQLSALIGQPVSEPDIEIIGQSVVVSERHHVPSPEDELPDSVTELWRHLREGTVHGADEALGSVDVEVPLNGVVAVERRARVRAHREIVHLKSVLEEVRAALDEAELRHEEDNARWKSALEDAELRRDEENAAWKLALSDAQQRVEDQNLAWKSALDQAEVRHQAAAQRWRDTTEGIEQRHAAEVEGWRAAMDAAELRHVEEIQAAREAAEKTQIELSREYERSAALESVEERLSRRVHEVEETLRDRDAELHSIYTSIGGRVLRRAWNARRAARNLRGGFGSGVNARTVLADALSSKDHERPDPARALPAPVHFHRSEAPRVSVVVPVHGQLEYTARCLASLAGHRTGSGLEVIVINDASPDETADWLRMCSGFEIVDLAQNVGYLRATNEGLRRSKGEFVLLLNNDTTLEDGCVDALVEVADRSEKIGAVGAKLIYPDGVLQEAGSIIWSDGTGWNYGRGESPDDYRFDFVREVDYCSAACLLVRRAPFADIGWFDERYVPAYYEDTDLCFALRDRGLRVMYQPAAQVIHYEGASHGTDESAGLKAHQVTNRHRFVEKWETALKRQLPPGSSPRRASWRGHEQRIMVFDHEVPAPDQDSGSVRMRAILSILVELGYRVTFFPHNRTRRDQYNRSLEDLGVEVGHGWESWSELALDYGPDLVAVIASRPSVAAEVIPVVTNVIPHVPTVYDMVDFHGLRVQRRLELAGESENKHALVMTQLERALVRMADVTVAITEDEAALVSELEPGARIVTIPNIHESPRSARSFEDRNGVLFIGSYRHPPNRDAIDWLVGEIMPIVWERDPQLTLHLVGSDFPDALVDPTVGNIVVHGWVETLDGLYDEVRLSIAPLRYGAGMKGKVGDSLIRGVPVVSTGIGAEGFGEVQQAIRIEESAAGLANAVVELHNDASEWRARARQGTELAEKHLGRTAARIAMVELFAQLASADRGEPRSAQGG